jgi:DNA-binding transcriptional ArsR family regulator
MPRAATTSDTFNAIAEPRRRDILEYLAPRERPVGDIVQALRLAQPSVSKHLRVLRDVGLVDVRRDGRQILYRTNAEDDPFTIGPAGSKATGATNSCESKSAPNATDTP